MTPKIQPLLYSYIRFSTAEQAKGNSSDRQLDFAKKIAKDKGLTLDDSLTMRDEGLSAYHGDNIEKGALGSFLRAIKQGRIAEGSVLVVESLDRLSRRKITECNSMFTQIICAGITVITAMDRKEYNKDILDKNPSEFYTMIGIFIRANEESEVKAERVRAALRDKCEAWQRGDRNFKVGSGMAPTWVKWDAIRKEYVFDNYKKNIMERKIELYSKGYGGLKIARLLNKEFGDGTVHHTGANVYKEVRRRSLIGELEIGVGGVPYILKNYYPAILSRKEFDSLVSYSEKRGAPKNSQKFIGLLSGIGVFKCGVCGRGVKAHVDYRGKPLDELPKGNKRYMCEEAARKNGCENVNGVQTYAVERAVVKYCQDVVELERVLTQSDPSSLLDKQKQILEEQKLEIDDELNLLLETASLLKFQPEQLAKKMNSLAEKQSEINNKLAGLSNKLSHADRESVLRVVDKWKKLTLGHETQNGEDRLKIRLLIKDTFDEIRLHPLNRALETGIAKELALIRDTYMPADDQNFIDLTLKFHNGLVRVIRIHKYSGDLIGGVEL
ncbi:recombinase family protein [Pseudoalteromonas sp. SA25]|uniref:recombinase family protein n=1 Tax=Pseudoalteromonas sp. SA25 TaxID=2686347 RepID=UPI0013FE0FAF|nr:recombinase family protein [Pseudoalteromonas sp. SA25]